MCERKICCICKVDKELDYFSKLKTSKDGHQKTCKLCASKYSKKRYLNNPNIIKERAKKWSQNNKEKRKEISNKYTRKKYYENINTSRIKGSNYKKK